MYQNYSVLMSVYHNEKPEYLKQAIESMLHQTIKTNNFVLVCDGPLTPELDSTIEAFVKRNQKCFQIVRLERNQGLGNALNAGLEMCSNNLVARMDSDDIALPYRCELQLQRFQENPMLTLCSGNIAEFENDINEIKNIRYVPEKHTEIYQFAKKRNPMNHMAVMYKKDAVQSAGGYIEINLAEDYYLWVRMLKRGEQASNIGRILVYARTGNGMYERRGGISYAKKIYQLQREFLYIHFISFPEFILNCFIRIIGSLIPTSLRKKLYEKMLRGTL